MQRCVLPLMSLRETRQPSAPDSLLQLCYRPKWLVKFCSYSQKWLFWPNWRRTNCPFATREPQTMRWQYTRKWRLIENGHDRQGPNSLNWSNMEDGLGSRREETLIPSQPCRHLGGQSNRRPQSSGGGAVTEGQTQRVGTFEKRTSCRRNVKLEAKMENPTRQEELKVKTWVAANFTSNKCLNQDVWTTLWPGTTWNTSRSEQRSKFIETMWDKTAIYFRFGFFFSSFFSFQVKWRRPVFFHLLP